MSGIGTVISSQKLATGSVNDETSLNMKLHPWPSSAGSSKLFVISHKDKRPLATIGVGVLDRQTVLSGLPRGGLGVDNGKTGRIGVQLGDQMYQYKRIGILQSWFYPDSQKRYELRHYQIEAASSLSDLDTSFHNAPNIFSLCRHESKPGIAVVGAFPTFLPVCR